MKNAPRSIARQRALAALVGCLALANPVPATAEVSLSGAGARLPGPDIVVEGNSGETRSTNLFHSFGVFNILPAGLSPDGAQESVTFTPPTDKYSNPLTIDNVISRVTGETSSVTGGKFSFIDGPLISTISGADFFFINPNGIIFGNNAALNIDGSFHAGTADSVKLGQDGVFYADPTNDSKLTASAPSAFGFMTSNPSPVQVQTTTFNILRMPQGETLSLIGGPVNIGRPDGTAPGFIQAPDGRINLVSVASSGEAVFSNPGVVVDSFSDLGKVSLVAGNLGFGPIGSVVDGQEVFIRSGNFTIADSVVLPGFFSPFGPDGGEVDVAVRDSVDISGTTLLFGNLRGGILTRSGRPDMITPPTAVPNITIDAGSVNVTGISGVRSSRVGPGDAATVTINADTVTVSNGGEISVNNFFAGHGGSLAITAKDLDLAGSAAADFTGLATQANFHPGYFVFSINPALQLADGGIITVNVDNLVVQGGASISSDSLSLGRGGDIRVAAQNMSLLGVGEAEVGGILAQSILGGVAGSVEVNAFSTINITDGFRISATTGGSGNGGSVNVSAGESITLSGEESRILSGTLQPPDESLDSVFQDIFKSPIFDFGFLQGLTGDPNASLMDVLGFLRAIRFFAVNDLTPGDAGTVSIRTGRLAMGSSSRIDTSTGWEGDAGAVVGNVGSLLLEDSASIRSRSGIIRLDGTKVIGSGKAGAIDFTAQNTITISGIGSTISTSTLGDGDAGDILLRGQMVNLSNGGSVTSDSFGNGLAGDIIVDGSDRVILKNGASASTAAITSDGGNIIVIAGKLIALFDSEITTSVRSGVGAGGNIDLDPPAIALHNSQVIANAFGGPGGNIKIVASQFIVDPFSVVDASSALGIDGDVNIDAPDTTVTGDLVPLTRSLLDASRLLRDRCGAARAAGGASSLVASGRGGVAVEPDGYLPSFGAGVLGSPVAAGDPDPQFSAVTIAAASGNLMTPWPQECP